MVCMEIEGKRIGLGLLASANSRGFIFSTLAVLAIAAVLAPVLFAPSQAFQASPLPAFQAREAAKALSGASMQAASSSGNESVYIIGPYLTDQADSADFEALLNISGKSGSYKAYFGPGFEFCTNASCNAGSLQYANLGRSATLSGASQYLEKIQIANCENCQVSYSPAGASGQAYNFTISAGGQDTLVPMPFTGTVSVMHGSQPVLELSYLSYPDAIRVSGPAVSSSSFYFRLPQDMLIYPQKTITDNGVPAWVSN